MLVSLFNTTLDLTYVLYPNRTDGDAGEDTLVLVLAEGAQQDRAASPNFDCALNFTGPSFPHPLIRLCCACNVM